MVDPLTGFPWDEDLSVRVRNAIYAMDDIRYRSPETFYHISESELLRKVPGFGKVCAREVRRWKDAHPEYSGQQQNGDAVNLRIAKALERIADALEAETS